jgi:hypothetical protein
MHDFPVPFGRHPLRVRRIAECEKHQSAAEASFIELERGFALTVEHQVRI